MFGSRDKAAVPLQEVICSKCVMDISDPEIAFDSEGVCSHCRAAEGPLAKLRLTPKESERQLRNLAASICERRKGKYDAVLGLSGGVDSSYTALLARDLGLNVLAVHFDNGWNSELAVSNIRAIVDRCQFDFVSHVMNWVEFRDLQRAFLAAGVVDIEILTDHAIMAALYRTAAQENITTILSGTNFATEHGMPRAWTWNKGDLTNIISIHRRFGSRPLHDYPRMGLWRSVFMRHLGLTARIVEPLDRANYRQNVAIERLEREAGWRRYRGKHYESVFTAFYQAYILPTKFGIDKRRAHLSALIRTGELARDAARERLKQPTYSETELRRERAFVLKKLGYSMEEFESLMSAPVFPHSHYATDRLIRRSLSAVANSVGLGRPSQ